ncbi:MAG: hypothetical protein PHV49_01195 [Alistipes sp.]|nr:hypothetical protein [Alistipes sp.]
MSITEHNYESWALDYVEGALCDADRAMFEVFLRSHAQIAAEVNALRSDFPVLPVEHCAYPDRKRLLRGGRLEPLMRIGSFVGGAVAASLVVGLFMLIERHRVNKQQQFAAQVQSVVEPHLLEDSVATAAVGETGVDETLNQAVVSTRSLQSVRPQSYKVAASSQNGVEERSTSISTLQTLEEEPLSGVLNRSYAIAAVPSQKKARPITLTPTAVCEVSYERYTEEEVSEETKNGRALSQTLATFIAPLDRIIPIKTYRTENESGIEIASILRIGNKIEKGQ